MANDLGISIGLEGAAAYNKQIAGVERSTNKSMGAVGRSLASAKQSFGSFANEVPILGSAFRLLSNPIAAVSAAVVGLGVTFASFTGTAAAFQEQMSTVGAIQGLDKTDAAFTSLTAKARELGRETEFTATQSAESFEFLSRAGLSATQVLAGAESTLGLATVGSLELARAAEIAADTLGQFKLPAAELGRAVDVIAKTTVSANTNVEQFAEAMKFLGPAANAFGVSIEESAATIGVLANSGLKGTVATTTLATAFNRLAAPPRKAAEAIKAYGIDAFDAQGKFIGIAPLLKELETSFEGLSDKQRAAAISSIFGQQASKQFQILLSNGSDELAKYTAELESAGAQGGQFAANIRAIKLDNFNGSLKLLNSAWEDFQIALTTNALPALQKFAEAGADALRIITGFIESGINIKKVFADNAEAIVLAGTALAVLNTRTIAATAANLVYEAGFIRLFAIEKASTIATAALTAGKVAYGVVAGVLAGEIGLLTIAQYALNVALTLNPIGLVVAAVGLLIAGTIKLYKESDTFRAIISGVWKVLGDGVSYFKDLWSESIIFRNVIGGLFGPLGFLIANFNDIKRVAIQVYNSFVNFIGGTENLGLALRTAIDPFNRLGETVVFFRGLISDTSDVFADFKDGVVNAFNKALKAISDFFGFDIGAAVTSFLDFTQFFNKKLFNFGADIAKSFKAGFSKEGIANAIDEAATDADKRLAQFQKNLENDKESERILAEFARNASQKTSKAYLDGIEEAAKDAEERLEILSGNVAGDTGGKIKSLAKQLSELGVSLPAIKQLETLDSKLDQINGKIKTDPGSNSFTNLIGSFGDLSSIIDTNILKIDDLGSGSSESLSNLGQSVNSIIDLINSDADEATIFGQISSQSSTLSDQIGATMAEIKDNIADAGSKLGSIGEGQFQDSPAIKSLVNQLGTVQGAISLTNKNLDNIGSDANINPDVLSGFTTNLGQLERQIQNINTDISLIGTDTPATIETVNAIQSQLEGLNFDINSTRVSLEDIGATANPDGQAAIDQLKQGLIILQNQTINTKEGLANLSANVDPESIASIEALQGQLIGLQSNIESIGGDGSQFAGLIAESQQLKNEIQGVTGRIVEIDDLSSLPLGALESKFQNIQEAIKLIDPNSSAFIVLNEQAVVLEERIDQVNNKIRLLGLGVDPNPIVVPITIQTPEETVDLGIVTAPATVPVEIETDPEAVRLGTLQVFADSIGASFETLKNTFFDVGEAMEALNGPIGSIISGLGGTDAQALKTIAGFRKLKTEVKSTIENGVTSAFVAMGEGIGKALVQGEGFANVMGQLFKGLVSTVLVEVPKLIGTFLIQTGVGLGFPAGIPFLLAGIGLTALSGVAGGLLSKIGGAKAGGTQVANIANSPLPAVQTPSISPINAVQPDQVLPQGLGQTQGVAPPPTIVRVSIGGEDLTDVLNIFHQTESELTGG